MWEIPMRFFAGPARKLWPVTLLADVVIFSHGVPRGDDDGDPGLEVLSPRAIRSTGMQHRRAPFSAAPRGTYVRTCIPNTCVPVASYAREFVLTRRQFLCW